MHFILVLFFPPFFHSFPSPPLLFLVPEGTHPSGPTSCLCCRAVFLQSSHQLAAAGGGAWQRELWWPLCCGACTMPWELLERMGMMYTGDIPGAITQCWKRLDCSGPINVFHSSPVKSTVESNFKHLDHTEYINTCVLSSCNNSMISMTPWWTNRISQAYFAFQMGQSWIFYWISTLIFS